MFYGETALNLDAKGRLAIPVRYRELIADDCKNKLVLTYNTYENNSLWLYPQFEWERIRDEVMALDSFDPAFRTMQRRLVGSAFLLEPDKGFRIQLPVTLRQATSLEKKVVMLGIGKKFEIWNEDSLAQSNLTIPEFSKKAAKKLRGLSL
jgi:MraZ protein